MRLHYLQHVWFEDLGVIKDWAEDESIERVLPAQRFLRKQIPASNLQQQHAVRVIVRKSTEER